MDTGHRIIRPLIHLIAALSLFCAAAASAQQKTAPYLLSPAEAFRLDAARTAPARVRLRWTISEGYYLYRDRFRFETAGGASLSTLAFPSGQPKDDPYFGQTEIFRDRVVIEIALDAAVSQDSVATLRIISQGCADIGVCFPPQTTQLELATAANIVVRPDDPAAGDPLAMLTDPPAGAGNGTLPFIRVRDNDALDAMLLDAKRRGAPAMLDFYADWCIPCRQMETRTLSAPVVRDALADTLLLRVDLSANLPADAVLLTRFGLERPPAILFFDRGGAERAEGRVLGFVEPVPFAARVRDAAR